MPLIKGPDGKPAFIGAFAYFFDQDDKPDPLRKTSEIFPPLVPDSSQIETTPRGPGSITTSRTLELWKEPSEDQVRIVGSTLQDDLSIYEKELKALYNAKSVAIDHSEPSFVSQSAKLIDQGYQVYFFDVEQPHGLPGCWFDLKQPRTLMDSMIRALHGHGTGKAAWIQWSWVDYPWGSLIEQASIAFQQVVEEIDRGVEVSKPSFNVGSLVRTAFGEGSPSMTIQKETRPHPQAGSSVHIHGKKVAGEYFEKAQKHTIILSIRGMVLSKEPIDALNASLTQVQMSSDFLWLFSYGDARMIRWLRSRLLPDPTKMLQLHASGGFMQPWGHGRELIPVLCITPEEMSVLVHLPTDPDLPVKYSRGDALPSPPGMRKPREGPILWD